MATANEKHISGLDAYEKHVKHSSGCVMICTTAYENGSAHSHRWQAARRARNEKRVPYNNYGIMVRKLIWGSEKRLNRVNATDIQQDVGARYSGQAKAFTTEDNPFYHNAHHIIPVGVLMKCILDTAQLAEPNVARMEAIVIGGILTETYNVNRKDNMIVLPTENEPAALVLGLPLHLEGSRNHNPYSMLVHSKVSAKFNSKYDSLASDVGKEKHGEFQKRKAPAIRPAMDAISNAMYEAIIGVAVSRKFLNESLDSVRHSLACRFARLYSG